MNYKEKAEQIAKEIVQTCVTDKIFENLVYQAAKLAALQMGNYFVNQGKDEFGCEKPFPFHNC